MVAQHLNQAAPGDGLVPEAESNLRGKEATCVSLPRRLALIPDSRSEPLAV